MSAARCVFETSRDKHAWPKLEIARWGRQHTAGNCAEYLMILEIKLFGHLVRKQIGESESRIRPFADSEYRAGPFFLMAGGSMNPGLRTLWK